jgi:hypothetical protein
MKRSVVLVALLILASPAVAQTSIRGVELSPEDAGRVARQCDALNAREMRSLAAETPEEPLPGETVSDAAGYWADSATGVDSALSRLNLDTLTLRECRQAGFY